jgi:hypothetical protein
LGSPRPGRSRPGQWSSGSGHAQILLDDALVADDYLDNHAGRIGLCCYSATAGAKASFSDIAIRALTKAPEMAKP